MIFTRAFLEKFAANRVKIPKVVDLFDVKQRLDETLRDFLNCLCYACTCITSLNEEFLVDAFLKGLTTNSFSESLVRIPALSLSEIRLRETTHIELEDVMRQKHRQEKSTVTGSKIRDIRRAYDDSPTKRPDKRYAPYVAQASATRPGRGAKVDRRHELLKVQTQDEALLDKETVKALRWPDPTN